MADKQNVSELARKHGIAPNVLHNRLYAGWGLEKALNTPVRKRKAGRRKKKPVAPLVTPAPTPTPTTTERVARLCKPCLVAQTLVLIVVALFAWWYMNA